MSDFDKHIDETINRIDEIHDAIGKLIIMTGPAPYSNRFTVDTERLSKNLAFVKAFVNTKCRNLGKGYEFEPLKRAH